MELGLCQLETPRYLIFSSNVPELLYYSHLPAIVLMLLLSIFLFFQKKSNHRIELLVGIFTLTSLWLAIDVVIWASNTPSSNIFLWYLQVLLEPLIYALSFLLVYQFLYLKNVSRGVVLALTLLFLPLFILAQTEFTLIGVNLIDCDVIEMPIGAFYTYLVQILLILGIILVSIPIFSTKDPQIIANKRANIYFVVGILAFLLAFTSGNIIGSLTGDWDLAQYGLFGIPVFVGILTYLIVRHNIFDAKLLGAQALVVVLIVIIASQFLYEKSNLNIILNSVAFILVSVVGVSLLRSIKRESKRKEELEKLTATLAKANDRLEELDKQKSEFISIASHQLRTPLTAIRGYISLALEGAYGKVKGTPIEDIMNKMYTIDLRLSQLVEDLLNVSKIEAGKVQYKWESVTLDPIVSELYDMFAVLAEKKGLKLHMIKPETQLPVMKLDINKIKEILSNLIDNAIKYTEKGSVTIRVEQDATVARVVIEDTGIGISKEDALRLFGKFIRTEITQKMDAGGSGLGLFVGKTFVEGHGGRVYATSEGVGKGSSFIVELPLINPNAS